MKKTIFLFISYIYLLLGISPSMLGQVEKDSSYWLNLIAYDVLSENCPNYFLDTISGYNKFNIIKEKVGYKKKIYHFDSVSINFTEYYDQGVWFSHRITEYSDTSSAVRYKILQQPKFMRHNDSEDYGKLALINYSTEGDSTNGIVLTFYFNNGNNNVIREISSVKKGIRHGKIIKFYETGRIEGVGQFIDGRRDGIWIGFNHNGTLSYLERFDGKNKLYNEIESCPDGEQFYYNEKGELTKIKIYRNCLMIEEKEFP